VSRLDAEAELQAGGRRAGVQRAVHADESVAEITRAETFGNGWRIGSDGHDCRRLPQGQTSMRRVTPRMTSSLNQKK